jgi:hypothetical protein
LLVILNAYYNDLIIPESLAHSSGKVWPKLLIGLIEGIILISAVYVGNRVFLSIAYDKVIQKSIANGTGIIQLIFTMCFTIAVILS